MNENEIFSNTPEVQETLDVIKIDDIEATKIILNNYFSAGIQVMEFDSIPVPIRLSFVQKTPKAFIKYRAVGGNQIPYIDHYFAEKCLNFVSNFDWDSEIVRSDIKEVMVKTKNGDKRAFDAMVEMNFKITLGEKTIKRFIVAGHRMFESPATTRADALKSAVSKANTVFARQLGVGANIIDQEGRAYDAIVNVMDAVKTLAPVKFDKSDFEPVKEEKKKPKKKTEKVIEKKETELEIRDESKNTPQIDVEPKKVDPEEQKKMLLKIREEQLEKEKAEKAEKEKAKPVAKKAEPVEKKEPEEKKEEIKKRSFDKEKFCGHIDRCRTLDELNKIHEAFQTVNKQIEEFELDAESITEIWDALKLKLKEVSIKKDGVADASDFDDLFS